MILLPSAAFSVDQSTANSVDSSSTLIRDIRMREGGLVLIHVLDAAGKPLSGRVVTITHQGKTVAAARSNAAGHVWISGLRSGIHVMASGQTANALRFWTADVAPQFAADSTAIAPSQAIIRGQYGAPMIGPGMLATGAAVAGIVGIIAGKNSTNESVPVPPVGATASATADSSAGPASP